MFCKSCGTENEENAKFCRNCGLPIVPEEETVIPEVVEDVAETTEEAATETVETVTNEAEPNYGQPNYSQPNYGQPNYGPQGQQYVQKPKQEYSGAAIASMILGIVSIVCCCSCLPGLGCGIAAICLAVSEKNKGHHNGMVMAGLVCGIIGASISAIYLILFIVTGSLADLTGSLSRGQIDDAFNDLFKIRFRF